jgi:RNA polymerase sigma factor (sigma-70 family)
MLEDSSLLRQYAESRNEGAFEGIVGRHYNGVYSAALRRVGGDAHLAKDVAQEVFTALARNASRVSSHPVLSAWLHTTTRNIAALTVRRERRRRIREEASAMNEPTHEEPAPAEWNRIGPLLDRLVDDLGERDRRAILLRFMECRSFAQVGAALSLSENAARMRVDRALDRLRGKLRRRGILSTTSALAAVLAEQAVVAAPAGLAAEAAAAALTGASAGTATGFLTSLVITTMNANKALIGTVALLAAVAGIGISEMRTHSKTFQLTKENQRLHRLLSSAEGREIALKAMTMQHSNSSKLAALGQHIREEMFDSAASGNTDAGHAPYRNAGQASPLSTIETFAWASDRGDTATLAKTITFGGNGRERAQAVLSALPQEVQRQFASPEELYALFIADDALTNPPPPENVIETLAQENVGPDRATLTLPGSKWSQTFENTPEGWKYVFPEGAVEVFAHEILDGEQSQPKATKG